MTCSTVLTQPATIWKQNVDTLNCFQLFVVWASNSSLAWSLIFVNQDSLNVISYLALYQRGVTYFLLTSQRGNSIVWKLFQNDDHRLSKMFSLSRLTSPAEEPSTNSLRINDLPAVGHVKQHWQRRNVLSTLQPGLKWCLFSPNKSVRNTFTFCCRVGQIHPYLCVSERQ